MNEYNAPTKAPDTIIPLNMSLPVSSSLRHKKSKRYYKRKKRPMTIKIGSEILGRIMRAVDRTPGLTFSQFCEQALELAVQKLETEVDRPTPLRKRFKAKRKRRVGSINLVV